ncbi:hypothetical protein GGR56DRAFT_647154 [Xylariaceae sp. FL0804]|nr:hypothetical protein GGR56DRAFT_647154 [Xylariaceae sp. FL0804]
MRLRAPRAPARGAGSTARFSNVSAPLCIAAVGGAAVIITFDGWWPRGRTVSSSTHSEALSKSSVACAVLVACTSLLAPRTAALGLVSLSWFNFFVFSGWVFCGCSCSFKQLLSLRKSFAFG